jgi:hypothetical protein
MSLIYGAAKNKIKGQLDVKDNSKKHTPQNILHLERTITAKPQPSKSDVDSKPKENDARFKEL